MVEKKGIPRESMLTVYELSKKVKTDAATIRVILKFYGIEPVETFGNTYLYNRTQVLQLFEKLENIRLSLSR